MSAASPRVATIVESTPCRIAALIVSMAIGTEKARSWIEKLSAALLDLESSDCRSVSWVKFSGKSRRNQSLNFVCLYSDAEFQVLLRELHYPQIFHGISERRSGPSTNGRGSGTQSYAPDSHATGTQS